MWQLRNNTKQYNHYIINNMGGTFNHLFVILGSSPIIVLKSAKHEIHIGNVQRITYTQFNQYAVYCVDYLKIIGGQLTNAQITINAYITNQ